MPFEAGHSVPGGRPKGAENKETKKLREAIAAITEGGLVDFSTVMNEIKETNPTKFLEMYIKLLEYSLPKLRSVDTNLSLDENTIQSVRIEIVNKENNG
jgi:hypothetical protein